MSFRLLIFGGSGQVGSEIRAMARPGLEIVTPGRSDVDLTDTAAIRRAIAAETWSGVINAAAYTAVDRAESDRAAAFAVNAEAPAALAMESARRGIPLIHLSTDYVFDGRKGSPYVETDQTAPLNVYGSSKLAGEVGVLANNPRHVVLRTAWVYSPFGRNFVKTILRQAAEQGRVSIAAEQRGCPTSARDIAQACLDISMRCAQSPNDAPYGIYHFAGAGEASRFELAQAAVALAAKKPGRVPEVTKSSSADHGAPAARPADTRLDCAAIFRQFGVQPRPWREALADTIARLPLVQGNLRQLE